jgi:hypothetical protein
MENSYLDAILGPPSSRRWLMRWIDVVAALSVAFAFGGGFWVVSCSTRSTPFFSAHLIAWTLNAPVALAGTIWLCYRSVFVRITPIERFAENHPRLWRWASLMFALTGVVLLLLAGLLCKQLC